jgi:hypothetical protein
VVNLTFTDVIGGKNATKGNAQPGYIYDFDRFGDQVGAILVQDQASAWTLPAGNYIQGDTTITMWVKGGCAAYYGNFTIFF